MKKTIDYLYRLKQANDEMGNYEAFNLYEAIEDLESLQNRKCENCKYNKEQDIVFLVKPQHNFMIFCDKEMCLDGSKMMWHSFTKEFSCKFWEPKQ